MTNPDDTNKLDEQIAEFTDRVLETSEEIIMDDINQANELAKLQRTILVLRAAAKNAQPDENVRARIHKNLQVAVRTGQPKEKAIPRQRKISGIAFASGFALLVLFGLVLVPLYGAEAPLTGTAEGSPTWLPFIIIIAGVAIIALLAWFNRQR